MSHSNQTPKIVDRERGRGGRERENASSFHCSVAEETLREVFFAMMFLDCKCSLMVWGYHAIKKTKNVQNYLKMECPSAEIV